MIHPAPTDIPAEIRHASTSLVTEKNGGWWPWTERISRLWSALHVSYRGGQYSIERLVALDAYIRTASLPRVVCVCLGALIPVQSLVIGQEAVPLQDPSVKWYGHYGFWVRLALVIATVFYTFLVQAKFLLKGFVIRRRQLILLMAIVIGLQVAVAAVFAAFVCFPIPFTILTMAPAFNVIVFGSLYAVVGLPFIRQIVHNREELLRFIGFFGSQQLIAVVYPAYQVLFQAVQDTKYELPVLLLLPIIKLAVKNIVLQCLTHMEDMLPEAVIFTVDFFNALYLSTCMENATSTWTVVIIVVIDIAQSASVLFKLHRRTSGLLASLQEAADSEGVDLVSGACRLLFLPSIKIDTPKTQTRQRVRAHSCLPHTIRTTDHRLRRQGLGSPRHGSMDMLRLQGLAVPSSPMVIDITAGYRTRQTWDGGSLHNVVPLPQPIDTKPTEDQTNSTPNTEVFAEVLEVLFTTECVVLTSFLDAVVPIFYGTFLVLMVHLPSAKYHTELSGMTKDNIGDTVDSLLVFAAVELVAFGLLGILIYRNLIFNVLRQLAFVLETQAELIQSKLVAWVFLTMTFRVAQFGVDFTFKFNWIKSSV